MPRVNSEQKHRVLKFKRLPYRQLYDNTVRLVLLGTVGDKKSDVLRGPKTDTTGLKQTRLKQNAI